MTFIIRPAVFDSYCVSDVLPLAVLFWMVHKEEDRTREKQTKNKKKKEKYLT